MRLDSSHCSVECNDETVWAILNLVLLVELWVIRFRSELVV